MVIRASIQLPASWAIVQEVIVVHTARGSNAPGDPVSTVVQYWSKDGDFLAEHDQLWEDPVWPACELRTQAKHKAAATAAAGPATGAIE